jgi:hypothetical protein
MTEENYAKLGAELDGAKDPERLEQYNELLSAGWNPMLALLAGTGKAGVRFQCGLRDGRLLVAYGVDPWLNPVDLQSGDNSYAMFSMEYLSDPKFKMSGYGERLYLVVPVADVMWVL